MFSLLNSNTSALPSGTPRYAQMSRASCGCALPVKIESSPYKQYKNAVTRAVGVYGSVEVDTFDFDILPGDRFLLCSDGMYAYVDEEELPKQLAEGEIKEVPHKLVENANSGGGHDNITAVVIRRKDFYEIIKREPALATKMLWSFVQVLADRLRKTTADLSGARAESGAMDMSEDVFFDE